VRVAATRPICASDLQATVGAVLDRRLRPGHTRPVAVALSGGGDSLALLLAAEAWARREGRTLVVLTVDHRLKPASADWTVACAATAARLGLGFRALNWDGAKPANGLPAAARAARHRLLADAASQAGARVILLGHTADDAREAARMRETGSTTPSPREWSPSPAWPEGRGLFLLRPLLSLGRGEIRDWLSARGETWIDDPANADLAYARPRARRDLAEWPGVAPPADEVSAKDLALACRADAGGGLHLKRASLRDAAPGAAQRFVSAACLCAAGTDRPPSAARVKALVARLTGAGDLAATLAGARIETDEHEVRFLREAGEAARGGLAPLSLAAGERGVWDGRFEITAEGSIEVRALAGLAKHLLKAEQAELRGLPPRLRPTLPVIADAAGQVARAVAEPLALDRLLAACGAVDREPA
jgi:tRNA(Ile)-lysidine synthase